MDSDSQLHDGSLYQAMDEGLLRAQKAHMELLYDFNSTRPTETRKREELLCKMLAEIGEGSFIEPPFFANWGGCFLHLGHHVYINHNLSLVDDTHIYIGDCTKLGPNVMICTAGHPILPELRGSAPYQFNMPVHIGRNCWIGAGVCILPGITIGDHSVIGAGSVVTKDIPARSVAVGNPCRVLRPISDRDEEFYFKNKVIDWNSIQVSSDLGHGKRI